MRGPALAALAVVLVGAGCSGPTLETDQSLATIVGQTTHAEQPMEVFPIETVRSAGAHNQPHTQPAGCSFVATGLMPAILEGHPAAMGLSPQRVNVTLVEMESVEAAKQQIAERDKVLDSGECRQVTTSAGGASTTSTITEQKTDTQGLESVRMLVSTAQVSGQTSQSASLLGRKGSVLVLVNSSNSADERALREIASSIGGRL